MLSPTSIMLFISFQNTLKLGLHALTHIFGGQYLGAASEAEYPCPELGAVGHIYIDGKAVLVISCEYNIRAETVDDNAGQLVAETDAHIALFAVEHTEKGVAVYGRVVLSRLSPVTQKLDALHLVDPVHAQIRNKRPGE